MAFEGKHSDITDKVIGAFFRVYNQLGHGFSEKVYENALVIELKKCDLQVKQQEPVKVFYEGHIVGEYQIDLLVNDVVIVELKAVRQLCDEHEAQLLNYLKATPVEVGLLLNFGPKAQQLRRVYDNERKGTMGWRQPEKKSTLAVEYENRPSPPFSSYISVLSVRIRVLMS